MAKLLLLSFILITLTLNGCAQSSKIIVDHKGTDMNQYQTDLAECQQLSEQVESRAGKSAASGAVIGAIVGEIVGGGSSTREGAQLGALHGGLKGGAATKRERINVVKNCLRHRGYRILN